MRATGKIWDLEVRLEENEREEKDEVTDEIETAIFIMRERKRFVTVEERPEKDEVPLRLIPREDNVSKIGRAHV